VASDYSWTGEWRHYRVGAGVLVEDGQVLLVGNAWYPDRPLVWTVPGGRAAPEEPVEAAAAREFAEETGLVVEVGPLLYVAEARSVARRLFFLTCAFRVRRVGGALRTGGDPVVQAVRFVPIAAVATYLPGPSLGAPLRHVLTHPEAPVRYWFFPEYANESADQGAD
jgi:ADP-ribose pyrophosphatase YjhB (NUDIX family)